MSVFSEVIYRGPITGVGNVNEMIKREIIPYAVVFVL